MEGKGVNVGSIGRSVGRREVAVGIIGDWVAGDVKDVLMVWEHAVSIKTTMKKNNEKKDERNALVVIFVSFYCSFLFSTSILSEYRCSYS
jgi:hypothetical protein